MSVRLKLFLFVIWILVLVYLFFKLKSRKADIKYILPWILLDAGMMVITAFPGILTFFCNLFGIETPSNMLFFFGLVFLAMIAFSMTLVISKQHAQICDLTQRMALYEEASEPDGASDSAETDSGV
ncbi:MAG: DUF2304 domain-containing protein [Lachnospiraceae bacterium]|nr:DUF2304 domain-containing protein [Lachnospiraceae bacterium]